MNLLLHICCAPCTVMPLDYYRTKLTSSSVKGFFYNPNIQPYQEYKKRLDTLVSWASSVQLELLVADEYDPVAWFRQMSFREDSRCKICYSLRLENAARTASVTNCDYFTTTLLYSVYQNRQSICQAGEEAAEKYKVKFLQEDFRPFWQEGNKNSREMGLYRQAYCGCIYSEAERYMKSKLTFSIGEKSKHANQPS